MKKQMAAGPLEEEPKKENISKFKRAVNSVKKRIRNRILPIVGAMMIAATPVAAQSSDYYDEDSPTLIEKVEKAYPEIKGQEALMHLMCLNYSDVKSKFGEAMEKVMANIGKTIEINRNNRIFCIALNTFMKEVLESGEDKTYFLSAYGNNVEIKDDAKNPKKTITISPLGKNGVEVKIENHETGAEKNFKITTKSKDEDVDDLKLEASRFFDNFQTGLIMIGAELEDPGY